MRVISSSSRKRGSIVYAHNHVGESVMEARKGNQMVQILLMSLLLGFPLGAAQAEEGAEDNSVKTLAELKEKNLQYVNVHPNILTNLIIEDRPQFIEIKSQIVTLNEKDARLVKDHMPQIRDYLLIMLTEKTKDSVYAKGGRRKLQEEALEGVRGVLEEETGKPLAQRILFSKLVME